MPDKIIYWGYNWYKSHRDAKSVAKNLRKGGYYAFIQQSGSGWQVFKSEIKRPKK